MLKEKIAQLLGEVSGLQANDAAELENLRIKYLLLHFYHPNILKGIF